MDTSILMVAAETTSLGLAKMLNRLGLAEKTAVKVAPLILLGVFLAAALCAWLYISSQPA
jgi:hypothetical protein